MTVVYAIGAVIALVGVAAWYSSRLDRKEQCRYDKGL